jgi:hypothetical protein
MNIPTAQLLRKAVEHDEIDNDTRALLRWLLLPSSARPDYEEDCEGNPIPSNTET